MNIRNTTLIAALALAAAPRVGRRPHRLRRRQPQRSLSGNQRRLPEGPPRHRRQAEHRRLRRPAATTRPGRTRRRPRHRRPNHHDKAQEQKPHRQSRPPTPRPERPSCRPTQRQTVLKSKPSTTSKPPPSAASPSATPRASPQAATPKACWKSRPLHHPATQNRLHPKTSAKPSTTYRAAKPKPASFTAPTPYWPKTK